MATTKTNARDVVAKEVYELTMQALREKKNFYNEKVLVLVHEQPNAWQLVAEVYVDPLLYQQEYNVTETTIYRAMRDVKENLQLEGYKVSLMHLLTKYYLRLKNADSKD